LLAKPTPRNLNLGSDRFAMFNKKRDIPLEADMGLVGHSQETLFYLRPKGWLRVDDLQTKEVRSSQAFVAMWFHESLEEPYLNGLHKAIYDSGYDPRRVDQKHHHLNKVDDEIIAEIRRSRFIVVDGTCEKEKVRGSVYFSARPHYPDSSASQANVNSRARWHPQAVRG
jgi:hypothetical protein